MLTESITAWCKRCNGPMFPSEDERADCCLICGNREYWDPPLSFVDPNTRQPIMRGKGGGFHRRKK